MITTEQSSWTEKDGWKNIETRTLAGDAQWVMVFGGRRLLEDNTLFKQVRNKYPSAQMVTCSTAGEIFDTNVSDNSLSVTAIHLEKTTLAFTTTEIRTYAESYDAGKRLAGQLSHENLVHVMVFSDGRIVNGTQLVSGLNSFLPASVAVTGGLVGDGAEFKKTLVGFNEPGREGNIVAIGFYGSALHVGYGSFGGWDSFGAERTITKSHNNVLYELDGQPALALYKELLGDQAAGLPSTALLFPLRLRMVTNGKEHEVVRTILGVDEATQSMTFAGDMPIGIQATLMKANFERLIDGASSAGSMSVEALGTQKPELALLVSCVGRKLVLQERSKEETEAVRAILGDAAAMTGFYSYGELCPVTSTEKKCELHNQTMTITTFREE